MFEQTFKKMQIVQFWQFSDSLVKVLFYNIFLTINTDNYPLKTLRV